MSNPTIKKRVCDRCGKGFFETYKEWLCKDCMNELGWEYTPKTNADHIRSMTDEDLAEYLYAVDIREGATDTGGWLDFIKQPYGGDT